MVFGCWTSGFVVYQGQTPAILYTCRRSASLVTETEQNGARYCLQHLPADIATELDEVVALSGQEQDAVKMQ